MSIELEPNGPQLVIEASLRENEEEPDRLVLDAAAAATEIERQTGRKVDIYTPV